MSILQYSRFLKKSIEKYIKAVKGTERQVWWTITRIMLQTWLGIDAAVFSTVAGPQGPRALNVLEKENAASLHNFPLVQKHST